MTAWSLIGLLSAMIAMKLSHFQALVVFALVISIAFGFLGRRRPIDRVKYILWTLLLFLLIGEAQTMPGFDSAMGALLQVLGFELTWDVEPKEETEPKVVVVN